MKKLFNSIIDRISDVQSSTYYLIGAVGVFCVALGFFTNFAANKAYDRGYKDGCGVTVVSNRVSAINAGVAHYVITNKASGETSFQYKTNRSTLF